jgi:coenzyme F420-0:L-glutamate ligase / coenzyme F420-1:gamma-L-glutamate ligase
MAHAEPGFVPGPGDALTMRALSAAAGIIRGQRGRGAPVAVLRGIAYPPGDDGVASMLHRRP